MLKRADFLDSDLDTISLFIWNIIYITFALRHQVLQMELRKQKRRDLLTLILNLLSGAIYIIIPTTPMGGIQARIPMGPDLCLNMVRNEGSNEYLFFITSFQVHQMELIRQKKKGS